MSSLKELFPGHFEPTSAEAADLWREGIFVIDANVLLKLYALPEQTRKETLEALKKLGARIWIPYQVAVEYHRNRVRAVGQARERALDAVAPLEAALSQFESAVKAVQLEKRGLSSAVEKMALLMSHGAEIIKEANAALASQVDVRGADAIRDSLVSLIGDRVGPPPSQQQLDEWYKQAKDRYESQMGPGHEDGNKKNAEFMHAGVKYNRMYGDYVLWIQTIEKFKDDDAVKRLVIITEDKKVDWWSKHNERISGPHPEMCAEIKKLAKLDSFWMYDLEEFLQEAKARLHATVSQTTLADVADASAEEMQAQERMLPRFRRASFLKEAGGEFRPRRGRRERMTDALAALGVDVMIDRRLYCAGAVRGDPQTWAISVLPERIREFVNDGTVLRLFGSLAEKAVKYVHFHIFEQEEDDDEGLFQAQKLRRYMQLMPLDKSLRVSYYYGDAENRILLGTDTN